MSDAIKQPTARLEARVNSEIKALALFTYQFDSRSFLFKLLIVPNITI